MSADTVGVVKTIRVELPVIAEGDVDALLDLVTDVDGVIAAIVRDHATLEVVVASDAIALRVREELRAVIHAAPTA